MTRPTISGVNIQTGEVVEREFTDDEYAQYLADIEASKGMYLDETPTAG
jgi:hypothetical protein